MKILCCAIDTETSDFLKAYNFQREYIKKEDIEDYFLVHDTKNVNYKCIALFDYDKAPELKNIKHPVNYFIIGLTSDPYLLEKDTTAYILINKDTSKTNIINTIDEIIQESVARQLGNFPLYVSISSRELSTPQGFVPLTYEEWNILTYFSKNPDRLIPTKELVYHAFYAGKEDEIENTLDRYLHLIIFRLRKKLSLVITCPVINTTCGGYKLYDCANSHLEDKIKGLSLYSEYIVIPEELRIKLEYIYKELLDYVAAESLRILRTDKTIKLGTYRCSFLKNNLIKKEDFTPRRLEYLLKKIRVKAPEHITQVFNEIDALEFKEED